MLPTKMCCRRENPVDLLGTNRDLRRHLQGECSVLLGFSPVARVRSGAPAKMQSAFGRDVSGCHHDTSFLDPKP